MKRYDTDTMGLLVLLITFCAMEAFSYVVHRYVFHGVLWNVHKTHHLPQGNGLEANDLFSIFFALVAAALIVSGAIAHDLKLWAGLGITLYGVVYFVFHDVLIHRRVRNNWAVRNRFFQRVVRAHKLHHKDLSKRGTEAYGLLWVPKNLNTKNHESR